MPLLGKLAAHSCCAVLANNSPIATTNTQRKYTMSIPQAIAAGTAGNQLSRAITGTDEVSVGRSAIATGAGVALGAAGVGALSVGAGAVGATALAVAAAPVVIPVAIVAGGISWLCSLFE